MRASTEATNVATILNSPPIHLKPHTPPQSQVPKSLPVSPSGTETQEPDAQDFTTSFISEQVAVTQEPATHSAAATQELAADSHNPDAQDVPQHVAATQEPAADIQNLDAQDVVHDVAATQEPATHSTTATQEPTVDIQNLDAHDVAHGIAATQEPTTETVTDTQSPVTLASLLQENEFLKSELEAYKQELVTAREAYDKELNFYTLAHVASTTEKSTEKDQYKEYMCSQCNNIYHQIGYKVVEIPLPGASPTSTSSAIKEECPTITQELVGPSKIKEERPTVT